MSDRIKQPPAPAKAPSTADAGSSGFVPEGSRESALAAVHRIARAIPYRIRRKAEAPTGKEDSNNGDSSADEGEPEKLRGDESDGDEGQIREDKEGATKDDDEAGKEPAPQISAKLEGGRTVFRAKDNDKGKIEEHRGRLQVQGKDMSQEVSWPWTRDKPPAATEALAGLAGLKSQLSKKELKLREQALEKAAAFINNAKAAGGVSAPVQKKCQNDNLPAGNTDARVDIEVIKGKAFV